MSTATSMAPTPPRPPRSLGETIARYLLGGALGAAIVLFTNAYGLGLAKRAFDAQQENRLANVEHRLNQLEPDTVRRQEMNDLKKSVEDLHNDVRETNRELRDMQTRMVDNGYLRRH